MATLVEIDGGLWLCEDTGEMGQLREEANGDISLEYFDYAKNGPSLRRWRRWDVSLRTNA